MPVQGDRLLSLLKGHLLIEELVRELVRQEIAAPDELKDANLTFDQVLCLARALTGDRCPSWMWIAVRKLNTIRNHLAHKLEPKGFDDRVVEFIAYVKSNATVPIKPDVLKIVGEFHWVIAAVYLSLAAFVRYKPSVFAIAEAVSENGL